MSYICLFLSSGQYIINIRIEDTVIYSDSMNGKVKMFNAARGFGFITGEDGKDVYVHSTAVEGGAALAVGDSVTYEVETSDRGLRAKNVKKV